MMGICNIAFSCHVELSRCIQHGINIGSVQLKQLWEINCKWN